MSVKLAPMDEEAFDSYYKYSMKAYAYEHVRAGNWHEDEALIKAQEQFEQLLPDGLATKNHVIFSVLYDETPIGVVWLHLNLSKEKRDAFIYDIELESAQRGQGYGKETLKAIDQYARTQGIKQIRLHVFSHNKRAVALYEKMGYETTDYHMLKRF